MLGLALLSAISLVLTHALVNLDLIAALWWPVEHPGPFLASFAILIAVGNLTAFVSRSYRWMLLLPLAPLWILGLICALKRQSLGSFLYPWDFYLSNEALAMLPAMFQTRKGIAVWLFVLTAALVFAIRAIPAAMPALPRRQRGFGILLNFIVLALLLLANNPLHDRLFGREFKFDMTNASLSFRANGLVVSFVLLTEQGEFYPPANYATETAHELFRKNSPVGIGTDLSDRKNYPDIVVVMSESLFDPLELRGVHWNEDPLAFTRGLAEGRTLSAAVVPTFGFRTANSEFEFLTGHSVDFFAKGTIPYLHLIKDHQLSMVSTLRRAGYAAVAIHPGARTFYERERVYQSFGFDRYLSAETFEGSPLYGNYYSDRSILPQLERSLAESTGPTFHFIVTLQNHYPYTPNPFSKDSSLFRGEDLNAGERVVMNYYAELLKETDHFHRELVDFLKTRRRRTLLLVFGDHLPGLLPGYGTYVGRMVDRADPAAWSADERRKMMTTPLAIWSNFDYPAETESIDLSFIGMRMLRNIGVPLPPYQKFVAAVSDRLKVVDQRIALPRDPESRKLLGDYKIFQYATFAHEVPDFEDDDDLITASTPQENSL